MDVLYAFESDGVCAHYRCRVPGAALERIGYEVDYTDDVKPADIAAASICVFERPSSGQSMNALLDAKKQGKMVVVELDDDLWHIDPDSPAYAAWNKQTLGVLDECIRLADLVTVTTPALADCVRPLNRNIAILPNMLPIERWRKKRPTSDGTVTIGWAGSSTHYHDVAMLHGVIENVLDRYEHVTFAPCGLYKLPFYKHERLVPRDTVPFEAYPHIIAQYDIGLAPVLDTRFNRAKSDLKALEYAATGMPVIASDCETYRSLPREAGFLCKTPADWLKALRLLIERPALREEMGRAARAWAETRTAQANVHLWEGAYGL